MSLQDHIPGIGSGNTSRNAIVVVIYLLLLPIVVILLPFYAFYAISTNRNGIGDTVAKSPAGKLPWLGDGGWKAGAASFLYLVVLIMILGAVVPGSNTGDPGANPQNAAAEGQTPTPELTEAASPTEASAAASTESPTLTQTETPTEAPTQTPTQTPTATPTPTPVPEPESQEVSGNGGDVSDSFSADGGLVTFDLEHTGESNFQVELLTDDGERVELLVNAIGDYDGAVAMYVPPGEYILDVNADGPWEGTIEQPRFSPSDVQDPPVSGDGKQHSWMGPINFDGAVEVSVEGTGDGNLAVWLATHNGEKMDLLANDIAPYETSTIVTQDGDGLLLIESDRAGWKIEVTR